MQQQLVAREHDTFEVVSYLRAENDTLQERLKHFEGRRRPCARTRVLVAHAASGQVARAKLDAESEKQRVRARTRRTLRYCYILRTRRTLQ